MVLYDVLKVAGQVVIPAIITCVLTILKALEFENVGVIETILVALLTCYNSVIVVWNANYYKTQAKTTLDQGVGEQG